MNAPLAPESLARWRTLNAEWLSTALERLRLHLGRRALWLQRPFEDGSRAADWLLSADDAAAERRFFQEHPATGPSDAIAASLDARLLELESSMRDLSHAPALRTLADLFGLSPFERDLLLLAAAPAFDGAFAAAYAEIQHDGRRDHATLHLALGIFVTGPTDRVLAADCLMPSRPLRSWRLIEVSGLDDQPLVSRRLGVDERIADYLRGINRVDARVVSVLADVRPSLPSDAAARCAVPVAELIVANRDRWTTVNLIGTIDDGARDVAERACATLDLRLRTIEAKRLAEHPSTERALHIALLGREAVLGGFALLVDATGLDRGSAVAEVVDELIARVPATLFVVSPERWPGEHDAHPLNVDRPTRAEQSTLWKSALAAHPHSVNGEVDAIVQQFDFGPSAIAAAVARASRYAGAEIQGSELWRACREQGGTALDDLARRITPSYHWSDIVVPDDVRSQLLELGGQAGQRGQVYERWGFGARLGRGRGIAALFSGASGTGKTMAAEILARHLSLDLYRIDLAGVVSKYIGETEKNLRRVFDAAERSGAILFFDEADALFGSRTEVRDSHDRYANVEINYLLQRMEDYVGLAILATNRRSALDGAFLRRLRFVIDFPFPPATDRRRIWETVFPPEAETQGLEHAFLSGLELAGGSIRNIAVNAAFLAAGEGGPIGMPHVMRAAAREYAKLSKPVTTAEFGAYHAMARP